MPVAGRKSKPEGQTRHRVKPVHDWIDVPNVPFSGGPKLPTKTPQGLSWPAWTRRWWAVASSMPHCALWSDADWQFALDTAAVKAEFHMRGGGPLATELRNRERVLGTTVDYRRDLRIRYVDPDAVKPEADDDVVIMDDYRAL